MTTEINTTETDTQDITITTSHTLPLPNFWRDNIKWRSTNTGMNENVISTYAPHISKETIVSHMRKYITPYTDKRKYLNEDEKNKHKYFIDIVNECMMSILTGGCGYVFTDSQLKEVMKIVPRVRSIHDNGNGCWKCWK